MTALKEVEVTAALELLHGMYYFDFDNMLKDVGELFLFTPGRSDYEPLEASQRKSFFFLLDKDDFSDLQVGKQLVSNRLSKGTTRGFQMSVEHLILGDSNKFTSPGVDFLLYSNQESSLGGVHCLDSAVLSRARLLLGS